MAKEQIKQEQKKQEQKKLSYGELEQVCAELQRRLNEQNRVNEIREMAYLSLEVLKCGDNVPAGIRTKAAVFIDKLIPVPKQEGAAEKE